MEAPFFFALTVTQRPCVRFVGPKRLVLPDQLEDARRLVKGYVEHYNGVRLNSAIGYVTPKDMLAGPPAGRVTDETDYFRIADDVLAIVNSTRSRKASARSAHCAY